MSLIVVLAWSIMILVPVAVVGGLVARDLQRQRFEEKS